MGAQNILVWLNFFIADVRDGFGPYLGVFLKGNGFGEGEIGAIATIANLIALLLGVPFGILVDKSTHKRTLISLCVGFIIASLLLNFLFPSLVCAFLAQLGIAVGAVFLAPAFAALTLGIVGRRHYAVQFARNEAYRHAGAVFASVVCLGGAYYFGIGSAFVIVAVLGSITLMGLWLISPNDINDSVARGDSLQEPKAETLESTPATDLQIRDSQVRLESKANGDSQISFCDNKRLREREQNSFVGDSKKEIVKNQNLESQTITESTPLESTLDSSTSDSNVSAVSRGKIPLAQVLLDWRVLFVGFSLLIFHLSNAAMLPLLSQRAHTLGVDSSGAYAAATIIIAQSTMIVVAFLCGRWLRDSARVVFYLMAICFIELIVRGFVAAHYTSTESMVIVQLLDGIGAGITGVIIPVFIALLLKGSGHISAGLSLSLTMGGVGSALSWGLGGGVAQYYGYFAAYMLLACVAAFGLVVWICGWRLLFRQARV